MVDGIKAVYSDYTLDGTGIVIGSVERRGYIDTSAHELEEADINFVDSVDQTVEPNSHMAGTTRIIVGSKRGFAPKAKIFCSDRTLLGVEELLNEGVQIITISEFFSPWNVRDYEEGWSDWADHVISHHGVTIVAAVGNTVDDSFDPKGYIYPPASGYNVIGVAAYQTGHYVNEDGTRGYTYTVDPTDDIMTMSSAYTSAYSGNTGAQKPDVIMPAPPAGGATSYATPVLTSAIALMLQLKPSLSVYPQAIKAIVLASCHRKVLSSFNGEEPEDIYEGITARQGAGTPDIWTMACIVCQGTYGVGRIKGAKTQAVRRFVMPSSNESGMNISITWLRENLYDIDEGHETETGLELGDEVDLSLSVYRDGEFLKSSNLSKSSTEMVYFDLNPSKENYEIRINEVVSYAETVRYGYAYSVKDTHMSPVTDEGIYYIRNYYTDKYLTLDTASNEAVMSDFTGDDSQRWIIRGDSTNGYEIYSGYGSVAGKLNFGTQVGTNPYYKAVLGAENLNLTMESWETDTSLEPDAFIFKSSYGGTNNILSYTYSSSVFVRSTTDSVVNMYRMWVLEDINYRQGDANMDGVLDINDATLIQQAIVGFSGTNAFSNQQTFLADVNYDGSVNIKDASLIEKIVAKVLIF